MLLSRLHSFCGCLSVRIPPLVLHVCLHGPPQRLDVALAKTRRPSSLDQLEEEGVLGKYGFGEDLKKISEHTKERSKTCKDKSPSLSFCFPELLF